MSWPRVDRKQQALRQEVRGAPLRGSQATGGRSGHATVVEAWRVLGCPRRMARLEFCVQGVRWRSAATSAETDGGLCESGSANPKRLDPGGIRSGSVGAALLDDAHDLQL